MGVLLAVGLLIEIAILAYVILQTQAERKALARFAASVEKDLVSAVEELPEPHRSVCRPFADQISMEQDLDDAIADAVVDVSRQPFKRPLALRIPVAIACAFAFLSPMSYGLLSAASNIVETWERAKTMDRSLVYLSGQTELEAPFAALRDGFQASALLFFGLAFVWAFAWHQRRPEVREARFVRALLEASAKLRPGMSAPAAGRLSELLAPDRGLGRPISALIVCLIGITIGWQVLYRTAEVRAANIREPVFDVWPAPKTRPVEIGVGISLPVFRAGTPIVVIPPSLAVSPSAVTIGGETIAELEDRQLPEGWEDEVRNLSATIRDHRVMLVGDREISIGVVLDVLAFLRDKYEVTSCDLLIERNVRGTEAGGRVLQASLPLELGPADEKGALSIAMEERGVRILPSGTSLPYAGDRWQAALQAAVRANPTLLQSEGRAAIDIIPDEGAAYERLVEILASADTACSGRIDCGLPGLGLRFRLRR
jgi:hypothetical protein